MSGQTTLSGGEKDAITIPTTSYSGCSLSFYGQAKQYAVKLDQQSGSSGTTSVTATYDAAMPSITVPTRTGYVFGGYYTDTNGGGTQYYTASGESAGNWGVDANATLYAKWTANTYTVTFDWQSGSGGSSSVTATYGSAMPEATMPTRAGYKFGGYYTAADGGGTQYYYADGTGARAWDETGDATLYAKWTPNTYTVTFDRQSGSGGSSSVTATYNDAMPSITVPTRTGYKFGGYYTAADGGGTQYYTADGTGVHTWDKTDSAILYAKWAALTYTVTLDRQSGSGGPNTVTATYGSAMPEAKMPTRSGYTFGGYYTEVNGGGKQYYKADGTSARNWNKASETTLYAKWMANTYTIELDRQDGSGGTSSVTAKYGMPMLTPIVLPTRTGYTFGGYYTHEYGIGTQYYTENGESANDWSETSTTNLYAKWTRESYTVTFDANGGSGAMDPMYCTYNVQTNLTPCAFSRDGWGFKEWTNSVGEAFANCALVSNLTTAAGTEVALYACWTGATYVVTFDACDWRGDGVMTNAVGEDVSVLAKSVVVGDTWGDLPAPTNETARLEFAGWKYDAGGWMKRLPATVPPPSAGVTNLVAIWTDGLAAAVDAPRLEFGTFGTEGAFGRPDDGGYSADWFAQSDIVYDGANAVQSGSLPVNAGDGHLYVSWLTTKVEGKGVLSFYWKCDAEQLEFMSQQQATGGWVGDIFRFGLYDPTEGITNEVARLTNHVDWCQVVYTNESESAVSFAWAFVYADYGRNNGGGTGWVDRVTWKPENLEYVVSFDANGGDGRMADQVFTNDVGQALYSNAFVRTGYSFDGWATNSTGEVVYADGANVSSLTDVDGETVTLFAKWTATGGSEPGPGPGPVEPEEVWTVTFDANDGSDEMSMQSFTNGVEQALSSNAFVRTGHVFAGWATNSTGEAVYADGESVKFATHAMLYAVWKPNEYTVTLHTNGGEGEGSVVVEYGTEVGDIAAPTLTGHTFAGWFTAAEGGDPVDGETSVTGDMELFAQWTVNFYTLTFDSNGGSEVVSITQDYGTAVTAPDDPTRTGYKFDGWQPALPETMPAENMRFTAQWTENKPAPPPEDDGNDTPESGNADTPEQGNADTPEQGNADPPEQGDAGTSEQGRTFLWTPVLPDGGNGGDAVFTGEIAEACDGYIQDAVGNVMGTISLKAAKAKGTVSKLTVKLQLVGEKKVTVKGDLDIGTGRFKATDKFGRVLSLLVGANSLSGTYGPYSVDGAQNKFTTKNAASKAIGSAVLDKCKGATTVAWKGAQGWNGLSISVANKGRAKITGTLADGTRVSARSQLIVGESWSCMPVICVKKDVTLAFNLWLPYGATATSGAAPAVIGLGDDVKVGGAGSLKSGAVFHIDAASLGSVLGKNLLPYLPDGLSVTGGEKWTLPKAGKVVYVKGTATVDEEKAGENPSGLKLTYKAKDGTFKGSFKAYADEGGKPKATRVSVTGVVVDGVGYGSAAVRKIGGVPVKIE